MSFKVANRVGMSFQVGMVNRIIGKSHFLVGFCNDGHFMIIHSFIIKGKKSVIHFSIELSAEIFLTSCGWPRFQ
ncbi:hypothetical protein AMQ68_04170 [Chryseobacterium sp. ERMR1:04]|nr:hypothetical protein AMQ68_04170 [Chryseobacterium sp. ERMR1:04]